MGLKKRDVIRTTVPMDREVYAVFERMAAAASMPIGRAIAEWCADTIDGAQFVAQKMEQARKTPHLVMKEMQSSAAGLLEEVRQVSREVSDAARGGRVRHARKR